MGRSPCTGDYLRVEMANLLKVIENEFVKKYGGDAKSVGNMLLNNSNECIAGSREKPTSATFSMHMFGLAVDVNYCGNPFVETRDDIRALNTVLKNAALLMNEPVLVYEHDRKSNFDKVFDKVKTNRYLAEIIWYYRCYVMCYDAVYVCAHAGRLG